MRVRVRVRVRARDVRGTVLVMLQARFQDANRFRLSCNRHVTVIYSECGLNATAGLELFPASEVPSLKTTVLDIQETWRLASHKREQRPRTTYCCAPGSSQTAPHDGAGAEKKKCSRRTGHDGGRVDPRARLAPLALNFGGDTGADWQVMVPIPTTLSPLPGESIHLLWPLNADASTDDADNNGGGRSRGTGSRVMKREMGSCSAASAAAGSESCTRKLDKARHHRQAGTRACLQAGPGRR